MKHSFFPPFFLDARLENEQCGQKAYNSKLFVIKKKQTIFRFFFQRANTLLVFSWWISEWKADYGTSDKNFSWLFFSTQTNINKNFIMKKAFMVREKNLLLMMQIIKPSHFPLLKIIWFIWWSWSCIIKVIPFSLKADSTHYIE